MSSDDYEYLGDLPEVGGPAADSGRAPAREPSTSAAAALGEGLGETRAEVRELRSQLQDVLARQGERADDQERLQAHMTELTRIVTALSEAQQHGQDQDDEAEEPRPMDWAQVPVADRAAWVQDRVRWVRDVLLTDYDHAAALLRPCWPLHTTLLNDMSLLEWIYEDGFGESRRLISAESFRRTLETVLERAERLTRTCPQPESDQMHPVPVPPRDDSAQAALLERQLALREALGYYLQAGAVQGALAADAALEDRHRAEGQVRELGEMMRRTILAAGVNGAEWEAFKGQALLQLRERERVLESPGEPPKS